MKTLTAMQYLIWLDQLIDKAAERRKEIRAELELRRRTEYADEGLATTVKAPDIATMSSRLSKPAVTIADPDALRAWVAERHPEQIQTTTTIRAAYMTWLGTKTVKAADDQVAHPETGEIIPGLVYDRGGRFLGISIVPEEQARETFGALAGAALEAAELAAGPAIGVELARLDAAETPGHLDPTDVPA